MRRLFFFSAVFNFFPVYVIKVNVKNMTENFKPKITLFHCINAFSESDELLLNGNPACEIKTVKMACSSMVKDVFLLRAFEAGADAVVVMVCPEGQCRYVEGNIRAKKRVAWVRNLLDEIGLDGRRLSLINMVSGDKSAASRTMDDVVKKLAELGPNPAA
jgi:F420-non-reducing hydrogenase iron-sulfur subunit